jgi:uncharacterized membrane protein
MIEWITRLLPGLAVMPNPHPLLVHLPIALFPSFFLAELLAVLTRSESLRHAASWMLYFGMVGAALTVGTGLWAAETVEHDEAVHAVMERHELYGFAVLGLSVFLSIWRLVNRRRFTVVGQWIHLFLAVALVGIMIVGADLGGIMVYGHAVGVRNVPETEEMEAIPFDESTESLQPQRPEEDGGSDTGAQPAPSEGRQAPVQQPAHKHKHPHVHKHPHKHKQP